MSSMDVQQTLEVRECGVCGMLFAAPRVFMDEQRRLGQNGGFWCPAGHQRVFRETTESILRKEKEQSALSFQAQLNDANHARLVAEKAAKKAIADKRKVERRIAHGVCPCCNKTFADISNHMLTEHKDFRLPAGKPTKQIEGAA